MRYRQIERRCTIRLLGQPLPKRNIGVSGISSAYRKADCTVCVVMNDLRTYLQEMEKEMTIQIGLLQLLKICRDQARTIKTNC
jgi:hypothetical protein